MHEMGIASSVLDAVHKVVDQHPGSYPSKVGLRIGEWAGVDLESLRFCFEALAPAEGFSSLKLEIEYRPRGPELDIAYVELEE
jgi:Zn finger protein HypA/HybF involved in hydrogenase expression